MNVRFKNVVGQIYIIDQFILTYLLMCLYRKKMCKVYSPNNKVKYPKDRREGW